MGVNSRADGLGREISLMRKWPIPEFSLLKALGPCHLRATRQLTGTTAVLCRSCCCWPSPCTTRMGRFWDWALQHCACSTCPGASAQKLIYFFFLFSAVFLWSTSQLSLFLCPLCGWCSLHPITCSFPFFLLPSLATSSSYPSQREDILRQGSNAQGSWGKWLRVLRLK